MRVNLHHIVYAGTKEEKDWIVELDGRMHMTITTIQNMKASPENYAKVTNFMHALCQEWQRLRKELDTIEQEKENIE